MLANSNPCPSEPRTLYELFDEVTTRDPERVAFRFKKDGRWHDLTWAAQRTAVDRISKSLIALGVGRGDSVAILSSTRLEWVQCDSAIVNIGGVTAGIYPSNLGPACAYIIDHSAAALLFVENGEQLEKIRTTRSAWPALRSIVIFDGYEANGAASWREFLEMGAGIPDAELERRRRSLAPDDLASLVYTSGTTGQAKGVMISHANFLFTTRAATQCLALEGHETTLLFLPLAHVFARLIVYLCMRLGVTVCFAEELGRIAENMKEVRPHFILSVPRIYEKFHDKIVSAAERAGTLRRWLFGWALGIGGELVRRETAGEPISAALRLRHALADRLVLSKVREVFGGRLEFCVSGSAPLNPKICEFFLACGIKLIEGLGMTENASLSNVNPISHIKPGTVGPVVPGVEMKLAPDGEVLFRGSNVMAGYYKDPAATAEAIDADGWLHSGDIGEIDADQYLKITDRKKELIVTAGGKKVAPQRVEKVLRESRFISQAVAYGDRRKFISALLTLEAETLGLWATENGLGGLAPDQLLQHPAVRTLIEGEVAARNRELASFESVKQFRILPCELSVAAGELTPTLKLKRKVIYANYQGLLDEMYGG